MTEYNFITATKEQIAEAFTMWNSDVNKNPDNYVKEEENPSKYANMQATDFIKYIREIQQ